MRRAHVSVLACVLALLVGAAEAPEKDGGGFTPIFDGTSLGGWHVSHEPGHGSGCDWRVEDGAIRGLQAYPGAWGILFTEKAYGDFELALELKADSPFEAGILLRSTPEGHAYVVSIQPGTDGDVGGITASRFGTFHSRAAGWKAAWKAGEWNEVRVAAEGQPPAIRTWLNGKPVAEARGKDLPTDPRVGAAGRVALKLAGPAECFSDPILFRNIRIKEVK